MVAALRIWFNFSILRQDEAEIFILKFTMNF